MALTENGSDIVMPVTPLYNGGGNSGGFGFGDNGWWIILLFILLGGWGGGFGYGNAGAMPFAMNTQNDVQRGFDQSSIMGGINGLQAGISGISTQLCNGFAGVNAGISNGFSQSEIAANSRQMADMNQMFGLQTAITGGMNNLQSQFANCCCENRMATLQTQNVVKEDGALTRAAIQAQTQAILDKMCQQEIDTLKSQNLALQNQVNMLNLAASQTAQTAQLIADNTMQTQYIVNRVAPYPIPAYTVANPVTPAATSAG